MRIGITERGDGAVHFDEWMSKMHTVDGAIVITKDPKKLLERLDEIPDNVIIHCTITGLSDTVFEPNIGSWLNQLTAFHEIASKRGKEKTVLRIDPIIPVYPWYIYPFVVLNRSGIDNSYRLRVSFLDYYNHIKARLSNNHKEAADTLNSVYQGSLHAPLKVRQTLLDMLSDYTEVCGEPGLSCTGCVSDRDLRALNLPIPPVSGKSDQRKACQCIAAKTELLNHRHPCKHGCLYCYWKS
jgi:DNA repair photolyase